MMAILQINLNRSILARDLMYAKAKEEGIDVMLTSEQPQGPRDDLRRFSCSDGLYGIIFLT